MTMQIQNALQEQYEVILDRKVHDGGEKSYTNYLFREGLDKILKKCGEECFETVIAAKNEDMEELLGELCDVFYHTAVLLGQEDVAFADVMRALNTRCQRQLVEECGSPTLPTCSGRDWTRFSRRWARLAAWS